MFFYNPKPNRKGGKMAKKKPEPVYIALDVEASGRITGHSSLLSIGACVVTKVMLPKANMVKKGLTFYRELEPIMPFSYKDEAMKVGCLGLECLKGIKERDKRYDPQSPDFQPQLVCNLLLNAGKPIFVAMQEFLNWINSVSKGRMVIGVTDTVFFDSGLINYYFGRIGKEPPFNWGGLDMDSLYRGYKKSRHATLHELVLPTRKGSIEHNALDDAIQLADITRKLWFHGIGD